MQLYDFLCFLLYSFDIIKVQSKLTKPVPVPGERSLVAPADGWAHEVGPRHLNLLAVDHCWWWIMHRQQEGCEAPSFVPEAEIW